MRVVVRASPVQIRRQDLGESGFREEEGGLKEFQTKKGSLEKRSAETGIPTTLEPFIEAAKVEPLVPEVEKAVIASYTNPLYRLRLELENRGFKKHRGYTTADLHYERKIREMTWVKQEGVKHYQTITWTQQVWLFEPQPETKQYQAREGWRPCYNANPAASTCAPPRKTAEEAVEQILMWLDEWKSRNDY